MFFGAELLRRLGKMIFDFFSSALKSCSPHTHQRSVSSAVLFTDESYPWSVGKFVVDGSTYANLIGVFLLKGES